MHEPSIIPAPDNCKCRMHENFIDTLKECASIPLRGGEASLSPSLCRRGGEASGLPCRPGLRGGDASGLSCRADFRGGEASGVSCLTLRRGGDASGLSCLTPLRGGEASSLSFAAALRGGEASGVSCRCRLRGGEASGVSCRSRLRSGDASLTWRPLELGPPLAPFASASAEVQPCAAKPAFSWNGTLNFSAAHKNDSTCYIRAEQFRTQCSPFQPGAAQAQLLQDWQSPGHLSAATVTLRPVRYLMRIRGCMIDWILFLLQYLAASWVTVRVLRTFIIVIIFCMMRCWASAKACVVLINDPDAAHCKCFLFLPLLLL